MSQIFDVPISFFFDGLPENATNRSNHHREVTPDLATQLLSSADGLALAEAFVRLKNKELRRRIVRLIELIGQ
jgi:hypothetical protein